LLRHPEGSRFYQRAEGISRAAIQLALIKDVLPVRSIRPETLPNATFQQPCGKEVALTNRSKSFPWPRNSYRAIKFNGVYFEWLADGNSHAL
jgi:hypothetical protein